ncbi:TMEM175 family protein [Sphingobium subterraneum]|uniref:Putative membrane protein n=1 Tax=Sphingobium subterraneum TaxID=627688 RepID=A0A841IW90_9SPHN|nr:TMEM175 family protein [Sphingobium subterraneum]MBB6123189.1 putative membrane protein [Sphingobium subterraneum]
METNRVEAFSDGVLAIILTIMVLELKIPHTSGLGALSALWPVFVSYVLSFAYVGIYWNNHHHLFQATRSITGKILWANLLLLFWLSLLPFTTGWMGENHFERWPTILYGVDLLLCAVAYFILERVIISVEGNDGVLARALGSDLKGRLSPVIYLGGIASAWWVAPWAGMIFFVGAALMWMIPDPRIERELNDQDELPSP